MKQVLICVFIFCSTTVEQMKPSERRNWGVKMYTIKNKPHLMLIFDKTVPVLYKTVLHSVFIIVCKLPETIQEELRHLL